MAIKMEQKKKPEWADKMITSKSNPVYKMIKSLKQKKSRQTYQCYFIEGKRLVREAWMYARAQIMYILIPDDGKADLSAVMRAETESAGRKIESGVEDGTEGKERVIMLNRDLFHDLCDTEHPQRIGAVMRMEKQDEEQIQYMLETKSRYLILDDLQDPGNVGTVIRTADAAGFDGVFSSKHCVDIHNAKVLRATMGSVFHIPVIQADETLDVIDRMKQNGVKIYAGDLNGHVSLFDEAFQGKTAIILGNEGNGISKDLLEKADVLVKIPMQGNAESLNASVAAGILMYEVLRKQNAKEGRDG